MPFPNSLGNGGRGSRFERRESICASWQNGVFQLALPLPVGWLIAFTLTIKLNPHSHFCPLNKTKVAGSRKNGYDEDQGSESLGILYTSGVGLL